MESELGPEAELAFPSVGMQLYDSIGDEESVFRVARASVGSASSEEQSPEAFVMLVQLAWRKAKEGDFAQAERMLTRTEALAEEVGHHRYRFIAWGDRGYVRERVGDRDGAAHTYELAVREGSTDAWTYTHLFMAYEKSRRWADLLAVAERSHGCFTTRPGTFNYANGSLGLGSGNQRKRHVLADGNGDETLQ